jgi:hypothetical protein
MEKVYLLLRNNVQSGPFSYAQLVKHSLKPSDLVWVEGESTAWLTPAELEATQNKKRTEVFVDTVPAVVPAATKQPPPKFTPTFVYPYSFKKNTADTITSEKSFVKQNLLTEGEQLDFRVHKKGARMVSLDQLAAVGFIALVLTTAWYGRHQFFAVQEQTLSSVAPAAFVSEESFAAKQPIIQSNAPVMPDSLLSTSTVSGTKTEINTSKNRIPAAASPYTGQSATETVSTETAAIADKPQPIKQKDPQSEPPVVEKETPKVAVAETPVTKKEEAVTAAPEETDESKKKKSFGQAIKGIFKKKKKTEGDEVAVVE